MTIFHGKRAFGKHLVLKLNEPVWLKQTLVGVHCFCETYIYTNRIELEGITWLNTNYRSAQWLLSLFPLTPILWSGKAKAGNLVPAARKKKKRCEWKCRLKTADVSPSAKWLIKNRPDCRPLFWKNYAASYFFKWFPVRGDARWHNIIS